MTAGDAGGGHGGAGDGPSGSGDYTFYPSGSEPAPVTTPAVQVETDAIRVVLDGGQASVRVKSPTIERVIGGLDVELRDPASASSQVLRADPVRGLRLASTPAEHHVTIVELLDDPGGQTRGLLPSTPNDSADSSRQEPRESA